ncbi:hypothetical protein VDG1235_1961 [Verrucomicrobiia bacterium DG1235]|nr:hypothetical protein VDG1235_1961 [Verrucomicrobiae bacterium DG1235]
MLRTSKTTCGPKAFALPSSHYYSISIRHASSETRSLQARQCRTRKSIHKKYLQLPLIPANPSTKTEQ